MVITDTKHFQKMGQRDPGTECHVEGARLHPCASLFPFKARSKVKYESHSVIGKGQSWTLWKDANKICDLVRSVSTMMIASSKDTVASNKR